MKLYDLPAEAQAIEQLLSDAQGELTPELEQRLKAFTEGGAQKLEQAAMVVRSLKAQAYACKAEETRLAARRTSLEANVERLRSLMLYAVDNGFKGKVKTPLFTIWGQTSADTASFKMAPDADMLKLPDALIVKVDPELNHYHLRYMLKAGKPIPPEIKVEVKEGIRFLQIR